MTVPHQPAPERAPAAAAPAMARAIWAGLIVAVGVVIGLGVWSMRRPNSGAESSAAPLPVLGTVPDFSLTERSGRTVTRADLMGTPWIADFIFTQCAGVCPILSGRMAQLQRELRDGGSPIRLVSFSVDPTRDTPAVLQRYADQYHADPQRWLFLTGPRDDLHTLIGSGFRLSVAERSPEEAAATGELITHSDRFVLVDASGQIRGYYHGSDAEGVTQLLRDIPSL